MKRLPLLFLLLAFVLPLQAQVDFGIRAGITDGEPMIGAELLLPIAGDFVINPNVEFTSELFSANADVHYDFDVNTTTSFWIGAGLAFLNADDTDDYEGGVNLLGGVGMRRGSLYPYGQVKFTSSDPGDFTSIAIGLRF